MQHIHTELFTHRIMSFHFQGYTVPKGWSVVFSIRETHQRNPSVPDPYTFNPAQWLEPDFSQDKHAYLPFGAGPRICPGQAYGKLILQLFAVELARTCTARITQDSDIQEWPTPRPMDKMLVKFQQIWFLHKVVVYIFWMPYLYVGTRFSDGRLYVIVIFLYLKFIKA